MKFVLILFLTLIAPLSFAQPNKPKVIIYADSGYPPYSFENNSGKTDGIYVQIVSKIFEKMKDNYDISLIAAPWKRSIDATKNGAAFGLLPPYKNLKDRPWLAYSEPILTEHLAVFCNDKNGIWPDSYIGKHVAINYGFSFTKNIYDLLASKKMTVVHPKNNEQSLTFLAEGKASCYINDENSIYYTIKSFQLKGNQFYPKAILTNIDGFLGYSHDKKSFPYRDDFINKFNSHLRDMKRDKEIDRIIEDFLQKAIFNNKGHPE